MLKLIPKPLAAILLAIVIAFGALIIAIMQRIVIAAGTDFNGDSLALPLLVTLAQDSFVQAITLWGPLHLAVILLFALIVKLRRNSFLQWAIATSVIAFIFAFLVAMYVSQTVAYRSALPLNMRYDFPKMLFTPLNYCLLACYSVYLVRQYLTSRAADRFSICAALILTCVFIPQLRGITALPKAAAHNIETTTKFYNELQSLVRAAKASPQFPIILEAHDPLLWAYEPVFSLSTYLKTFGVNNPVSVRVHSQATVTGLAEGFKKDMLAMQGGDERFAPLAESIDDAKSGCISVGINGPPASECGGFEVRTE
jgi:hypothetical protein